MLKTEEITFQALAKRFKKLEDNFVELKIGIKIGLKHIVGNDLL